MDLTLPILGAAGALVSEIIKQWEKFGKMPEKKFKALFRSWKTWAAAIFLIVVGGLSAWFLTSRVASATPELGFFSGVGAMSLLRQFLAGASANRVTKLGPGDRATRFAPEDAVDWKDVF